MKQIRVCGVGDYRHYYSYFLYGIMEGAIRNGCWFRPVSMIGQSLEEIEKQVLWFKPHIVLCHGIFGKEMERKLKMLKKFRKEGIVVFYHLGDARPTPRYCDNISEYVDFALLNHSMIPEFETIWKVKVFHWPYFCFYSRYTC